MIVRFVWRPADHFLLRDVAATFEADGASVPALVGPGNASTDIPDNTLSLRCTLVFQMPLGATKVEVLRIDQQLQRSGISAHPVFDPVSYQVLTGPGRRRRTIPGMHPLLRGALPTFAVRTALVDVTELIPSFGQRLAKLASRAGGGTLASTPRILARTDGLLPQIWIVATPHVCQGAAATDLLCFLGPSQNHRDAPALESQVLGTGVAEIVRYGAVMLGGGTHDGAIHSDHYVMGDGFIIARGFERSLAASGKHAILAIPVPANLSHNAAASPALPGLLADVHRLVVAMGDAHPPLLPGDSERCAQPVDLRPRLALAAHSRGALALWGEGPGRPGALGAGPDAYSDLLLFEALNVSANLHKLEHTGSAGVLFAGYSESTVAGPFRAAALIPSLLPRIRRIPVAPGGGAAAESASLGELALRSPSLAHALSELADWPSDPSSLFVLKHQLAAWSGDMTGLSSAPEVTFLVQALNGSGLR